MSYFISPCIPVLSHTRVRVFTETYPAVWGDHSVVTVDADPLVKADVYWLHQRWERASHWLLFIPRGRGRAQYWTHLNAEGSNV